MMKRGLSKKGVSVLVGYVLLVVFAIVISGFVYTWLKTYVPSDALECSDGVSIFLREVSFDETNSQLRLIMVNNGRFNVAGYFIHASNNSSQTQPTIELSGRILSGGTNVSNSVWFSPTGGNVFEPGEEETSIFNLSGSAMGEPLSVQIIPVRFQEENNVERFVSCGSSRILQDVGEPVEQGGEGGGEEGYVEIGYFGFESGEQSWVDGGSDSDRSSIRSNVDDAGVSGGSWSWHIQDDTSTSYTEQNFDLSGYSEITISFLGYYEDVEEDECLDLWVDGIKVGSWGVDSDTSHCNEDVSEDTWISRSVILGNSYGSSVTVRFEGEFGGNGDEVYIDGVNITGIV